MVWRHGAWFPTKDRGRIDDDGYFYHAGRADDVIISAGWTMSAVEIENTLAATPGGSRSGGDRRARRAARPGGEGVHRHATAPHGDELVEDIQTSRASGSASTNFRAIIAFVAELPKTPAGKVNRKVLRDREAAAGN